MTIMRKKSRPCECSAFAEDHGVALPKDYPNEHFSTCPVVDAGPIVVGLDFAPFCRICGAEQLYEPDHCETDEWQEAVFCDQCGKAYADKQRDPDCIGCGSIE